MYHRTSYTFQLATCFVTNDIVTFGHLWTYTFRHLCKKWFFVGEKKDAIPTSQSRSAKALLASSPKRGADGMYSSHVRVAVPIITFFAKATDGHLC